jgi:hypothetical protein
LEVQLRLSCQKIVLLVAAATLGCSDSLSPRSVSGFYRLQAVNGQPLPAAISTVPGESWSVVEGSLTLTSTGYAAIIERRQQLHQSLVNDLLLSGSFTFELDGHDITLFPDCPPEALALCGTVEGVVSGSSIVLTFASSTYQYARVQE